MTSFIPFHTATLTIPVDIGSASERPYNTYHNLIEKTVLCAHKNLFFFDIDTTQLLILLSFSYELKVLKYLFLLTRPHKHVTIFGIFVNFFLTKLEVKYYF